MQTPTQTQTGTHRQTGTQTTESTSRYDFREATRGLVALMREPSDVTQVFRIINALPGRSFEWIASRMRRTPESARLLHERPSILRFLRDPAYLRSLPGDSLGAAYQRFIHREQISADGLVEADLEVGWDDENHAREIEFVRRWLRDTHDLWHVVTGYSGDLLGEAGIIAFLAVQSRHPGFSFIGALDFAAGGSFPSMRRMIVEGAVRGVRSAWLPGQDWLSMLPLPVEEVRRRLRVPPLRPYRELRVADLPGGRLPDPPRWMLALVSR